MEVARGEVWWADLPEPVGSAPGGSRPVLVVQADAFNRSRISTVVVAVITSNLRLAEAPGNVLVAPADSGLDRPSVVNVSQLFTADRGLLRSRARRLRPQTMRRVEEGLALVQGL